MAAVSLLRLPSVRWAVGGWTLFIAENALLSENRTWLIEDYFGDDGYHAVYGTCSTIATASIGYAYYTIKSGKGGSIPVSWNSTGLKLTRPPLVPHVAFAWFCTSLGLAMVSQSAPKIQIPVAFVSGSDKNAVTVQAPTAQGNSTASSAENSPSGWSLQVRCPFDFTDKRSSDDSAVFGTERISRHPGLWAFGLVGLGQACLAPSMPLRLWWMGPAAVAWLGGAHTDSRFRRGMGGNLKPEYESQTSNIPFAALLTGRQAGGWSRLQNEMKPLNALSACVVSSLWILRYVR